MKHPYDEKIEGRQQAKKLMSDSPRLVDFAFGLVDFILLLPIGQVLGEFFFEVINLIHHTFENFSG